MTKKTEKAHRCICGVQEGQQHKNSCSFKRGQVPYIHWPPTCARCGEQYYNPMFVVPHWEWRQYVDHPNVELCRPCYDQIKGLIDERGDLPELIFVDCPKCKGIGMTALPDAPADTNVECTECRKAGKVPDYYARELRVRMRGS